MLSLEQIWGWSYLSERSFSHSSELQIIQNLSSADDLADLHNSAHTKMYGNESFPNKFSNDASWQLGVAPWFILQPFPEMDDWMT